MEQGLGVLNSLLGPTYPQSLVQACFLGTIVPHYRPLDPLAVGFCFHHAWQSQALPFLFYHYWYYSLFTCCFRF